MKKIEHLINIAKKRLLKMHFQAGAGHIGGNLSCIDLMIILHQIIMSEKDQFVLSKGHAAGALYTTLWSLGKLSEHDLESFCKDNTNLPGHPSGKGVPGLLFPTGSLGHGPSLASGLALAARHQKTSRHVFCLCSDGEWQEGSCWEALIFSIHQKLENLTILIDQNGWQGFGRTEDVISCKDLERRIIGFGATVLSCDGHNSNEILKALQTPAKNTPRIIICKTRKGNGTLYENQLQSHYLPLSEENYSFSMMALNRKSKK